MAKFINHEIREFEINCPGCGHEHVVKAGIRRGEQRYQCQSCKKKFQHNGKSEGQRFDDNWIGTAIFNYYSGMSYETVARGMQHQYGIPKPSKSTIYNWVRYNGHKAFELGQRHKANTGDRWVADEIEVDGDGDKIKIFNVMDEKSRFLIATHATKGHSISEAKKVMAKAVAATNKLPKEVRTDGLPAYGQAVLEMVPGAEHVTSQGARKFINNNLSERLQGTLRERIKTLRGLQNVETTQEYIDGVAAHYNYVRLHEGIGNITPAQAAGVNPGFDNWIDVVKSKEKVSELPHRTRPDFELGRELTPGQQRKKEARARYGLESWRPKKKGRGRRFGVKDGRLWPLINKNGNLFLPRDKVSLEQRKLTTEREKAGKLHYGERPGLHEQKNLHNKLVPDRMLRERPPQPSPDLAASSVYMKRQRPRQRRLEDNTNDHGKKVQPKADLKAATVPKAFKDGHQISFEEHDKKQKRVKAPEPVMPQPIKVEKPKPPSAHLTDQIMRQMRPKTPGRKHR